ncbi:unannotated protein [freshwater metagenome]|uniref:Unannotated protein n=1 Tax=freshwater metagenome TaxID=449393 RepID=A0A6J7JN29_9ZZZZ
MRVPSSSAYQSPAGDGLRNVQVITFGVGVARCSHSFRALFPSLMIGSPGAPSGSVTCRTSLLRSGFTLMRSELSPESTPTPQLDWRTTSSNAKPRESGSFLSMSFGDSAFEHRRLGPAPPFAYFSIGPRSISPNATGHIWTRDALAAATAAATSCSSHGPRDPRSHLPSVIRIMILESAFLVLGPSSISVAIRIAEA